MNDILIDLDIKSLPQIQGYNGEYTDEDFVFETFKAAAEEIRRLRALNEKAAKTLKIATAALGTLATSGNHIALNAMLRIVAEIADA